MSDMKVEELQRGLPTCWGRRARRAGSRWSCGDPPRASARSLTEARIEPGRGVVGDRWAAKPTRSPEAEVTLMNARCIALLAGDVDRWPLAGDQLYVDFDLGVEHLPAGSRLASARPCSR